MNFLAHIYLSDNDEEITIGNFIADAIKGKQYLKYPPRIAKGIVLHRAIDTFTDAHPTFRQSTSKLHKTHSHYSGVIVDVLYDHFLAKNWADYHEQPLAQFVQNFYAMIQANFGLLPARIQRMTPYMIADNWLMSYATVEGVDKILGQMNMRTKGIGKMDKAVITLQEHYEELEAEFSSFFEELIQFSNQKLLEL
jgi:acyl carrier protein phosphodiesterase